MKCANCGAEFEPSKYAPNAKCCSKKCSRAVAFQNWYQAHREEFLLKQKIYRITGKYPKGKLK
ncbi:MAG: hypothetical protein IJQ82_03095 [Selenomonadaceae bacterium]|nr:hypothetical protein [Selenomonadaceae bacterium]